MDEKELKHLKKRELYEILLAQSREIDRLRQELSDVRSQLEDKKVVIKEAGSLAEASLRLTAVFEEAQKAATIYLDNLREQVGQNEK